MPLTLYARSRSRRILTLALVLVALASCLALPGRRLNWLLPSVSATTTDETTDGNNIGLATPGVISFAAQNYSANESDGAAGITLTRTGGSDGVLSAKITLTDGTTSPADYILSPGSLDPTFITPPQITQGSAGSYSYPSMALQPDGKLLLADIRGVWRLNTDGSIDTTFNVGNAMNWGVSTVAVQPDGKIIVGGPFTTVNNQRANHLVRLNSDGSLDPTFDVGTGPDQDVSVIVIQPDGKVLISGYFMSFNGVSVGYQQIMRLNSDGTIDNSFTRDGIPGLAIALQPDGKILGVGSGGIKRANTNGTLDNTFNAQFTGTWPFLFNLVLQPDGKVIIVGLFDHVGGQVAYGVARLNADGSVDPTFNAGTGPDTTPQGLALQPDGKVLIGGGFKSFNGTAVNDLVRLNANGSLDPTFAASPNIWNLSGDAVNNILLQPDGKVFIRGYLTATGSNVTNRYLARLRNDLFVTWAAGDANNKTVSLPVVDDLLDEPDETLNLTLVPLNGAAVGANSSATLTIIDSDVPPLITSALPPSVVNVNATYSHQFTATGAPAPTFSVTSPGGLPAGLFLLNGGLLTGTPYIPGTYNITIRASNGVAPAATQSFTIKVNGAPSAQGDSYSTIQNTTLTVAAPGVLGNDSDPNSDPITATVSVNPLHGTVTLGSDGSFVYIPNTNYFGSDNFSYIVNDGTTNSFAATVFITIFSGGTLSLSTNAYNQAEDAGSATITVSRGGGSAGEVRVDYATSDGTATAGTDYTATSGTLIFANGVNTKTFSIPLTADKIIEPNETVNITLSNLQGTGSLGTQNTAVLTILNDDTPVLQFERSGYGMPEGSGSVQILVNRAGGASLPVTINYATSDTAAYLQNCNVLNGTATSRCDYVGVLGTLHFAANETSKTISIPIVDDTYLEGAENFSISLSNPTGGAVLGTNKKAVIQIADNDTNPLSSNPIDSTAFFVRQHYIDFLGREPDPASIGWNNQINNCVPLQPSCDRLSVSQGIYNSPEFKDRGYFIYKFYSVAFGRKPTYDEFVLDRARVSGFQTEAELEQSKLDFIADFMSRPEFSAYAGLTDDQYVLRFFNLTGITQVTVGGAVFDLAAMQQSMRNGKTRAQVLREVAESPEVSAKYQVESTIVMHYFGYLRRDPDGAYQDWTNIYNQTGDARNVTNGFVNSLEYRSRFGQ
jgi:uncharacterized delta-60 repeat protein